MTIDQAKIKKTDPYRQRRLKLSWIALVVLVMGFVIIGPVGLQKLFEQGQLYLDANLNQDDRYQSDVDNLQLLEALTVKGRAPKTGYDRDLFGQGWQILNGCTMRNIILKRDLTTITIDENCKVKHGFLNDPYSGREIEFFYGATSSSAVQIDHIVAVSDAWQKGAQSWSPQKRIDFYNDPLNLLAVDGEANQAKGNQDAASWLPANKSFRCHYIGRQVQIKAKYELWLTEAEKVSMARQLTLCSLKL